MLPALKATIIAFFVVALHPSLIAPEIKDEAKFFSLEAVRKANRVIRDISKRFDRDVFIETFTKVPGEEADRVRAMSPEDRAKFFHNWAVDRAEAAVVHGVYILICKDPATLSVHVTERGRLHINEAEHKEIRELLLRSFRDKKYDEGLAATVELIRNKMTTTKKP